MNSWLTRCYLWLCQRLYHELAWSYDAVSWLVSLGRWATWRRATLAYLPIETLVPDRNRRILEIGFGTGELLLELTRRGLPNFGLEPSLAMHARVMTKLQRWRLFSPRVCGYAQALPFAAETFDAIVTTFPASYILEATTLHEANRVLRRPQPGRPGSGGRLIIVGLWVSINQPWLAMLLPIFYGKPDAVALQTYCKQLTAAGFDVEPTLYDDGLFSVGVIVAQKSSVPEKTMHGNDGQQS